jgi:hypothetical protein
LIFLAAARFLLNPLLLRLFLLSFFRRFTIWVPPVSLGLFVHTPYHTGFPDGFLFLSYITCKIEVLINDFFWGRVKLALPFYPRGEGEWY